MQPIFFSFVSGLHYRKTVKLYFRRISMFYLVVSIYENTSFRRFLSFLTAGNKSYCGTLQRLTHPQQSTAEAISRPVSPPKRQAMQGKSLSCRRYTLELLPTCEYMGLQSHLCPRSSHAHSSAPHPHPRRPPVTPIATPRCAPPHPHSLLTPATPAMCPSLPKSACNSRTGVTQQHEVIQTSNILRGIACEIAEHRTVPPKSRT